MSLKHNPLREKYLSHVEKQKTSGLSFKKYCAENDLVEHKLSYYRNYELKSKKSPKPKAFSSVKVKESLKQERSLLRSKPVIDPIWLSEFLKNLLGSK